MEQPARPTIEVVVQLPEESVVILDELVRLRGETRSEVIKAALLDLGDRLATKAGHFY